MMACKIWMIVAYSYFFSWSIVPRLITRIPQTLWPGCAPFLLYSSKGASTVKAMCRAWQATRETQPPGLVQWLWSKRSASLHRHWESWLTELNNSPMSMRSPGPRWKMKLETNVNSMRFTWSLEQAIGTKCRFVPCWTDIHSLAMCLFDFGFAGFKFLLSRRLLF